jgi:uncharacterized protein with FMN-binding domain
MAGTEGNTKKIMTALAVLVLVAVMVLGVNALDGDDADTTAGQPTARSASPANDTPAPASPATDANGGQSTAGTYKDGQYSARGEYTSPGGRQSVSVRLTLQDGKVTDAAVEPGAKDRTSEQFQSKFISGYEQQVVGKDISELRLSNVSGSSLTPQGFNDAVEQIKEQAAQS